MVRLKLYTLITLIIASYTSCNSQPSNIKTIKDSMYWDITKLESETGAISFDYQFEQYFLLDSLNGFIIGNNSGAEVHNSVIEDRSFRYKNIQTVIFKTTDGGKSFQKTTLGKGSIEKIVSDTQNNLYLIKRVIGTDTNLDKYSILKSTDLGTTWSEFGGAKSGAIKNIQFYNELKGIATININKKMVVIKTTDGGKTWYELDVDTNKINPVTMVFLNENKLYSFYKTDKRLNNNTATIDFESGKIEVHNCELPNNYGFSAFFKDPKTNTLYSRVYKFKAEQKLMLYNHSKQELTTLNLNSTPDQLIIGISVYKNFIGVLRKEDGKTFYYYSTDNGNNWLKEHLPDFLTAGRVALYGRGLVWTRSLQNMYTLQVRNSL